MAWDSGSKSRLAYANDFNVGTLQQMQGTLQMKFADRSRAKLQNFRPGGVFSSWRWLATWISVGASE
jgi:hypothetical protein